MDPSVLIMTTHSMLFNIMFSDFVIVKCLCVQCTVYILLKVLKAWGINNSIM